ncbi:hypothetical protein GCM10010439_24080 [Actinocorallia aurantiaca]|uniref:Uncharacterized protein n=1 Tax=Actinocorallia aurantiaca TaxID=46204 RepID=A0ABN3U5I8_9ACTN
MLGLSGEASGSRRREGTPTGAEFRGTGFSQTEVICMRFSSVRDGDVPGAGSRRGPYAAVDLGSSRIRVSVPAYKVMIDRPSSLPVEPDAPAPEPEGVRPRRRPRWRPPRAARCARWRPRWPPRSERGRRART